MQSGFYRLTCGALLATVVMSCLDDVVPVEPEVIGEEDAVSSPRPAPTEPVLPLPLGKTLPVPPPRDARVAEARLAPAVSTGSTTSSSQPSSNQELPSGVEVWLREHSQSASVTPELSPSWRNKIIGLRARPSTVFCSAWRESDWRAIRSGRWPSLRALDVSVGDANRVHQLFDSRWWPGIQSLTLCSSRAGVEALMQGDLSRLQALRIETSFDVNQVLRRDRQLSERQLSKLVRHPMLQNLSALTLAGEDSETSKSLTPSTLRVLRSDFALQSVTHLDISWSGVNPAELLKAPWLDQLHTLCLGGAHSQSPEVLQHLIARGPWPLLQKLQLATSGVPASKAEQEKLQKKFNGRILWLDDCPAPQLPWKVVNRVTIRLPHSPAQR